MSRSPEAIQYRKLYKKHDWPIVSQIFLAQNPFCFWCGNPSASTDHIRPHRGDEKLFLSLTNWQPLCGPCHNFKSLMERRGYLLIVPENRLAIIVGSTTASLAAQHASDFIREEGPFTDVTYDFVDTEKVELSYGPHLDWHTVEYAYEDFTKRVLRKKSLGIFHRPDSIRHLRSLCNAQKESNQETSHSRNGTRETITAG